MELPVTPPVEPMLAKLARRLPDGQYLYEPKWDGFRCLVFRDGAEIELWSRNGRSLNRYFPELVDQLERVLPRRCVVDGELVVATEAGLDFDALLQRIHPASSRIDKLSKETPASFVAFDLLALGKTDLRDLPQAERRQRLEKALARAEPPLYVTPVTSDFDTACDWFERFEGAGLDGVVAKPRTLPYIEGRREMIKVKHERTADCVVGGYRPHKRDGVGSLVLGLYDDDDVLQHVGVCTGFSVEQRRALEQKLATFRRHAERDHPWLHDEEPQDQRIPGGKSRWSGERDTSWVPLRPTLVVEVAYDHLQNGRFRHATRFRRFRPDRDAWSCRYDQLEVAPPAELEEIFAA